MIAQRLWPLLIAPLIVRWFVNRYVRIPDPFDQPLPELIAWIHNHHLSGWTVFNVLCPESVHIVSHTPRWKRTGAVYHAHSHTAVIVESVWRQPHPEWIWNACHELAHPDQNELLWKIWRWTKESMEWMGLAGLGLFAVPMTSVIPMMLMTLVAGLYALADVLLELDAVIRTPIYLERALSHWSASEDVQSAWRTVTPHILRFNVLSYLRNTTMIVLPLWSVDITVGLFIKGARSLKPSFSRGGYSGSCGRWARCPMAAISEVEAPDFRPGRMSTHAMCFVH